MAIDVKKFVDSYEFDTTLPGSGKVVRFEPITTKQMKRMLLYENEEDVTNLENVLDELIQSCVTDEEFNIDNLYLQDRFFLLVELRKASKGNMYNFTFKCPEPECKTESFQAIDLSKLPVKKLDRDSIDWNVQLNESMSVELDFITRKDQKQAYEIIKGQVDPNNTNVFATEAALAMQALSMKKFFTPEGETEDVSLEDKLFIINNMKSDTYQKFSKWFTENAFGIDWEFELKCVKCGHTAKYSIPVTHFFD